MKKYLVRTATAAVAAGALGVSALAATPAQAAEKRAGTESLAAVLGADGTKFDKNPRDFDITEAAVLAVLDAKPGSDVGLLTQGDVRLTAFLPTDKAFKRLVKGLTGTAPASEKKTFEAVASVGIDTVEAILLYHVVPGATLTSPKVLAAAKAGAKVETATGATFKVHIIKGKVTIIDKDRDARNATAIPALLDINRGNKQVAHGINRVLRPIDL